MSIQYNAFISYSHVADGALSAAIQSGLQKLAKPWYKVRALNIYRDKSNLSLTPNLWSSIEDALCKSEYFILMASPKAADSKWVKKEISFWLRNKSIDTLILVITEGEIEWDNDRSTFHPEKTTAIPQILIEKYKQEPLYVDLREERSKIELSLENPDFQNKLIPIGARIRGISNADFISEEVTIHKRTKRIRNFVIIMLSVLLISSLAAAYIAFRQRNLAILQRDFAKARELSINAEKHLDVNCQLSLSLATLAAEKILIHQDTLFSDIRSLLKRTVIANIRRIKAKNVYIEDWDKLLLTPLDTKSNCSDNQSLLSSPRNNSGLMQMSFDGKYRTTWLRDMLDQERMKFTFRVLTSSNCIAEIQFIGEFPMSLAWHPNKNLLALGTIGGGKSIYILNIDSIAKSNADKSSCLIDRKKLRKIDGSSILKWNSNGNMIAMDSGRNIEIYDESMARKLITLEPDSNFFIDDLVWDNQDRFLASVNTKGRSRLTGRADSADNILIWNLELKKPIHLLRKQEVRTLSWSRNDEFICIASDQLNLEIFNGKTYTFLHRINLSSNIQERVETAPMARVYRGTRLRWSNDDKYLLFDNGAKELICYNTELFKPVSDLQLIAIAKLLKWKTLNSQEERLYLQ